MAKKFLGNFRDLTPKKIHRSINHQSKFELNLTGHSESAKTAGNQSLEIGSTIGVDSLQFNFLLGVSSKTFHTAN